METPRRARDLTLATAAYAALTLVLTWPVVRGLTTDLPGDFGDPLLNTWIVAWVADHLLRAATGHVSALGELWNANIFHPHPLALAYSEHLTAQALQVLPIYAITKNPILCYNLLFLSTFVLSGAGMFLFVRELGAGRGPAFVAGLAYAFAPYRFGSIPHVQVLSSAWTAFALFGFRRFFATGRLVPLIGAAVAWTLQNLSCGYYLLFFSPMVVAYLIWEISTRAQWKHFRTLALVSTAIAGVALATLPFALPYLALRQLGFSARSLHETDHFSADVYAYLTADPNLRLWGPWLHMWPRAENALFPGATIILLGAVAATGAWTSARRIAASYPTTRLARWLGRALGIVVALAVALTLGFSVRSSVARITNLDRLLVAAALCAAVLLAFSARARVFVQSAARSPVFILAAIGLGAMVMSFGPHIRAQGRIVEETSLYALFFNYVPGFDGIRVPARFGMVVAFAAAALAGLGAANLGGRPGGRNWIAALAVLMIVESVAIPLTIDQNDVDYKQSGLVALPNRLSSGDAAPPVYRYVAAELPASAVLIELPFGEVAFDVRYMFYSTLHWRPLVNGYSGGAPDDYGVLTERIKDALSDPDPAWQSVLASGATHAIVHEASYANGRGALVSRWLASRGARQVAMFGDDHVFILSH